MNLGLRVLHTSLSVGLMMNSWLFLKECLYSQLVECKEDKVLCKVNAKCVSKMRICDHVNDCPEGEDERDCFVEFRYKSSSALSQLQPRRY